MIDPSARIEAGATIGKDVLIGPYCTIGAHVSVGDGCRLIAHVNLTRPHHDRAADGHLPVCVAWVSAAVVQLSGRTDAA